MRILALSDFHSSIKAVTLLIKYLKLHRFDIAIIAGDLTTKSETTHQYILDLDAIFLNANLPWQAIHGNSDSLDIIELLKALNHDLHFQPQTFMNYRFLGIGGFGDELPPYDLKLDNAILITHLPPQLEALKKPLLNAPLLHLSGHIHRLAKFQDIGKTRLIQIPAALFYRAAIINLPSREVNFIHFD